MEFLYHTPTILYMSTCDSYSCLRCTPFMYQAQRDIFFSNQSHSDYRKNTFLLKKKKKKMKDRSAFRRTCSSQGRHWETLAAPISPQTCKSPVCHAREQEQEQEAGKMQILTQVRGAFRGTVGQLCSGHESTSPVLVSVARGLPSRITSPPC